MKRRLIISGLTIIVLAVLVYLGIGFVIYNQLTQVEANCSGEYLSNAPDNFSTEGVENLDIEFDATPYFISDYQTVSFPSRGDAPLTISAWYAPASEDDAPAVILVHGLGDCKRTPFVLTAGGMLHSAGFSVLMIDLRDHGDSEIEDGRFAGGTEEYRDVLGAWDWLVTEQGMPPERIGLMGFSLGGATALIAAGEEPQIAAVWEDSSYADIETAVDAELRRNGYPTIFAQSGLLMARLLSGLNLAGRSPIEGVQKLDGRPIFITHSTGDTRLSVDYAYDLAAAAQAVGSQVEPWIVPDLEHHRSILVYSEEYEARLVDFFSTALANPESE